MYIYIHDFKPPKLAHVAFNRPNTISPTVPNMEQNTLTQLELRRLTSNLVLLP